MPFITRKEDDPDYVKDVTKTEEPQGNTKPEDEAPELSSAFAPLFEKALFGKPTPKEEPKEEKKKEPVKPEDKSGKVEEPEEAAEEEEKKEDKPSKKKSYMSLDEKIARAADEAAKKTAAKFAPQNPPKEKTEIPEPEEPEIPDDYKTEYDALVYLEKTNPKYKGKASALVEFIKKENEYIDSWERENPDSTFDSTDEEHNEFYRKNGVRYPKSDLEQAKIDLRVEQKVSEKLSKHDADIKGFKMQQRLQRAAPVVQKQRIEAMVDVMKSVNPEYADKVKTQEGFDEVRQSDPLSADIVINELGRVAPLLDELVKMYDTDVYHDDNGVVQLSPDNPAHVELVKLANALEDHISGMSIEEQKDSAGKLFKPRDEFYSLSESQQKKYWTVEKNVLTTCLLTQAKGNVAKQIQAEKERYEKYFGKKDKQEPEKKEPAKPAAPEKKPDPVKPSPKAQSGDKVDTVKGAQLKSKPELTDLFGRGMFGR